VKQAPYVSYKTFHGFVRRLKDTVIPEKIDADVLRTYPGSTARQLKAALRLLALMDDGDRALPALTTLVETIDTPGRNPAPKKLLDESFPI
jgi:hypothetical protein